MDRLTVDPKPSVVEKLRLRWLLRVLHSTIGRKFVMGLTGLLLCGFLVAHLAGNLLLFGGKAGFDNYAHRLHEQEWLPLAEAGLLVLFVAHIYFAITITLENRQARRQPYVLRETKIAGKIATVMPSQWMFVTGAFVLGFLLLHLSDLRLGLRPDVAYASEHEAYRNTVTVLMNPLSRIVYMIGAAFLGVHLSHGFQAAFQSLGLSHPKYTPTLRVAGYVFAAVIGAGFFSLALLVPIMPHLVSQAASVSASVATPEPRDGRQSESQSP